MTKTQATLKAFGEIPPEKLGTKIKKTVAGLFLAALGIGATKFFGAPWWVAVGSGLLGATVWSGEIVLTPFKLLGAVVIDFYKKLKGDAPAA